MNLFRVKFIETAYWEWAKGRQVWDTPLDSLIGTKVPLADPIQVVEEFKKWCFENKDRKFIEFPVLYLEQQVIARFSDFIQ